MRDKNLLIISLVCFVMAFLTGKVFAFEYCITIPDAEVNNLVTALKSNNNYSPFLEDGVTPNPESGVDFAKRMPREYLKGQYVHYWGSLPGEELKRTAIQAAKDAFE